MKNYILLISLFISVRLFGQNITVSEMIQLLNKSSWEGVNSYLMNKGWVYFESEKEGYNTYGKISWSYGKSYFDDKAKGWIMLFTTSDVPRGIHYQFHVKSIYTACQKSINALGFKQYDTEIKDDVISIKYFKKGYLLYLSTGKSDEDFASSTAYNVAITKSIPDESELIDDSENKRNGLIKEYDDDGNLISESFYKNDVLNGPYKLYEEGKLKESGTYINGKKNGIIKSYISGRLNWEGKMKDDVMEGTQTFYYYNKESGKLLFKSVGNMKNNLEDGKWNFYLTYKGKQFLYQYYTYINGVYNGPCKIVEDSSITLTNYKDGQFHGSYKLYVDFLTKPEDQLVGDLTKAYLKEQGQYDNGEKTGKWKYYDKNGKLIEEIDYSAESDK